MPSLIDLQRLLGETMGGPPSPQNTSIMQPYRQPVVEMRQGGGEIAAIYEWLNERGSEYRRRSRWGKPARRDPCGGGWATSRPSGMTALRADVEEDMSKLARGIAQIRDRTLVKVLLFIGGLLVGLVAVAANFTQILGFLGYGSEPGPQPMVGTPNAASGAIAQATPGPTPVALPIEYEIWRDDFSSASSGWDDYSREGFVTGYGDGRYFIDISSGVDVLFLSVWRRPGLLDNGVLEVDILGPFGEDGAALQGLGFGWRNNWEGSTYAFVVNSSGDCLFLEASSTAEGAVAWQGQAWGNVEGFQAHRTYHTLRVQIRSTEAIGYVDGSFCVACRMPRYRAGYVGVVASASYGRGTSYFDEYRVFRLP